jgi:hypothetical protein
MQQGRHGHCQWRRCKSRYLQREQCTQRSLHALVLIGGYIVYMQMTKARTRTCVSRVSSSTKPLRRGCRSAVTMIDTTERRVGTSSSFLSRQSTTPHTVSRCTALQQQRQAYTRTHATACKYQYLQHDCGHCTPK